MQHFEIADVIIKQGDIYHLQLRNGAGQSGAMGQIGVFGGGIEIGETPESAACRELAEETNLELAPNQLTLFCEVSFDSDKFGQPCTVHAYVYIVSLDTEVEVLAREGDLVSLTLKEMELHRQQLSAVAKEALNKLAQRNA